MNKKIYSLSFIIFVLMVFMVGCGGSHHDYGSSDDSNNITQNEGVAQLGNIAGATVEIFEIDPTSGNLIPHSEWEQKTSSGSNLNQIGKFNTYGSELENEKFYLYKISGGKDYDYNDDGVIDTPIDNQGVLRLIAKGSDIKANRGNLRVTLFSELLFEKAKNIIAGGFEADKLQNFLHERSGDFIKGNFSSFLQFNPVAHKSNMTTFYKYRYRELTSKIHQGKKPLSISVKDYSRFYSKLGEIVFPSTYTGTVKNLSLSKDTNYLYVANGSDGILIIKITRDYTQAFPVQMEIVGTYSAPTDVYTVKASSQGDYLYAGTSGGKFLVLDVSNPSLPQLKGEYDLGTDNNVFDIDTNPEDTRAYVLTHNGVYILNIENKSVLQQISYYENVCAFYPNIKYYSETKRLCYTEGNEFVILDVSDETSPQEISRIGIIDELGAIGYLFNFNLFPDAKKGLFYGEGGCYYYELDNPSNRKGSFNYIPWLLSADGAVVDLVFFLIFPPFVTVITPDGKRTFIFGQNGYRIFDTTDPRSPEVLATILDYKGYQQNAVVEDTKNKIIFAGYYDSQADTKGIVAVDEELDTSLFTGETSLFPNVIPEYEQAGNYLHYRKLGGATGIAISSDTKTIWVANGNPQIEVLDLAASFYTLSASYDLTTSGGKLSVSDDGKALFAVDGTKVLKFDVTDPSTLSKTAEIDTGASVNDLKFSYDTTKLYLANDTAGVKVLNLSDLNSTTYSLGTYSAYGISILTNESYAFVASGSSGIVALNLANGSYNSFSITDGTTTYGAYQTALSSDNQILYVGLDNGIAILDISSPANIQIKSILTNCSGDKKVILSSSGEILYVLGNSGFYLVNVEDNANPSVIDQHFMIKNGEDMVLSLDGKVMYIVTSDGILWKYPLIK